MDTWKRFDGTSLPDKKAFYSELYLEDITDEEYTHARKVFKELGLKNLGDYHDFYVQSDTLLLADVFENFRNKIIEIYKLDRAPFLLIFCTRISMASFLKKDRIRIKIN